MFPQKTTKTPFLDDGSSWWTVLTVGTFPVSSSYSGGWGGGRERGRLACGERAVQRAGRGWQPAGLVCGWLMETQRAGDLPDNAQAPAAPGRRRDATFFLLGKGPAFSPLPPDRASHPVLGPPRGSAAPRLPPQQCSLGLGLGRAGRGGLAEHPLRQPAGGACVPVPGTSSLLTALGRPLVARVRTAPCFRPRGLGQSLRRLWSVVAGGLFTFLDTQWIHSHGPRDRPASSFSCSCFCLRGL